MPQLKLQELDEEGKPQETMTVEISEDEVKKLNIEQAIEIVIKGTVGMLQIPQDGEPSEEDPPLLGIKIDSKTIKGINAFDKLADEDEEEE